MSSILFEKRGSVAVITLNRPDKLNSFNREMALQMQAALDECKSKTIRSVYITGAGKGFCAGQDLAEVTGNAAVDFNTVLTEHYHPILIRIKSLEKPIVAAINGVAAGAGVNIALCCDIVVATESASFIQAFSKIGLIPDNGGTYNLPRLIGHQKAAGLMMLGEKISAAEAERIGLLYKVFPDDIFADESMKLATTLAAMPTKGLAYTKILLQRSADNGFEEQLKQEDVYQGKASQTEDYKIGVKAFLEKKPAHFTGE